MKHFQLAAAVQASLLPQAMLGVGAQEYNVVSTTTSTVPVSGSVTYQCVFVNLWTAARHPNGPFPGDAHWSSPIIVGHNAAAYTMWEAGALASEGVEQVAETGASTKILAEISAAGSVDALAPVKGSTQYHILQQEQTLSNIAMDATHYHLSSITMVAPSPDWFSGFSNFDVRDANNNQETYYGSFSIETFPWDAGTEMGEGYSINNNDQDPKENIMQITSTNAPTSMAFLNPSGGDVLPVARWDCSITTEAQALADTRLLGKLNEGLCVPNSCSKLTKQGVRMRLEFFGLCFNYCVPEQLAGFKSLVGLQCGGCPGK